MNYHASVFLCVLTFFLVQAINENFNSSFELSIIHFSDFHSRYVPVSPKGGLCYKKEKCIGGIARVSSMIKRLKQIRPNAILMNAGDYFQGTLYYDLFRGNITAQFMNELPYDVLTIGNHDFDDGVTGFESFVKHLKAPVVVTNIDQSQEPLSKNLYTNSTIIRRGNKDVGVIGVIYSDTDKISTSTGKLKFLNEVDTVNLEAQKLKAKGVNVIIVLSHCGINRDKLIAEKCTDVDVIVGGHSHILLYNGNPPNGDDVYDKYPIVVTQNQTNRKVLIVHASAFTKYMGDLRITFNEHDEVAHWEGNPIYLGHSVREDPTIVTKLQSWTVEVDKVGKKLLGKNEIYLNGSCTSGECNFGDFIADAMVDKYFNDTSIAVISALNVCNSIPVGLIVYEDIYMTLPYSNSWDLIELQGRALLQVLEENVAGDFQNKSFSNPSLLQFSGLKVVYNLSNLETRVIDIRLRSRKNGKNKYSKLDLNKWYKIAVESYLVSSAFPTISKKHRNRIVGNSSEIQNLVGYVKKIKRVKIKTGSRMVFE